MLLLVAVVVAELISPVASVDRVFADKLGLYTELHTIPDLHGLLLSNAVLKSDLTQPERVAAIFLSTLL